MLYRSERNVGCRFQEIYWNGMRCLVLENQFLHITVVLDRGADILEFNYKKTDTDFVWRNPMGLSPMKKLQYVPAVGDVYGDNYFGGFFEIIPSIGGCGDYQGIHFEGYCESNCLPWEYEVVCDTEECIHLNCFVRLNKLPLEVSREMLLYKDSPTLYIEEKVTNLGRIPIDFQWGWHPNIGGGFLNENCVIDMPEGKMSVMRESQRFSKNAVGEWPNLNEPGKEDIGIDYSRILPPGTMINELVDVELSGKGWAAVRDTESGIGIGFSWNPEVFPYAAIWKCSEHKQGLFRLGGTYVMCFLLRSQKTMGLPDSVDAEETVPLAGETSLNSYLTITVFEDKRQVVNVTRKGNVAFLDETCREG